MSKAYDAKNHVLLNYHDDKDEAVEVFLSYCDMSRDDFIYEFNKTPEEYIFGKEGAQ